MHGILLRRGLRLHLHVATGHRLSKVWPYPKGSMSMADVATKFKLGRLVDMLLRLPNEDAVALQSEWCFQLGRTVQSTSVTAN